QYQLSQMADQKANMLMATAFVIFTITVGQIKAAGSAPVPLLILGGAAFLAALFAVSAVMPAVKGAPPASGPSNMLFFGSFTQMPEDEYVRLVQQTAGDNDAVFAAFAHDIYQNGTVLARKKYRLLGYGYRVMLAGLVCSFIAFLLHLTMAI